MKANYFDVTKLDTSNVTEMGEMFMDIAPNASGLYLDLSGWNVCRVTSYDAFSEGMDGVKTPKIAEPNWGMACLSQRYMYREFFYGILFYYL